jgi:protein-L-isoaspartate(D-aspartate) O-methyltransferase
LRSRQSSGSRGRAAPTSSCGWETAIIGWPEHAPFDKVNVPAGADLVPPPLLQQLKPGGRMVIPTGLPDSQQLTLVEKDAGGRVKIKELLRVRFSLLEGAAD